MHYTTIVKDVVRLMILLTVCFSVAKCCSRPDLPDYGYLPNNRDTYNIGDKILLLCREGYAPKGKNYAICQPNGEWDQKLPSCEEDLAYSKMTKILFWDEVEKAYLEADSTGRLTDGNIDNCLQMALENGNFLLKIDLGNVYHIGNVAIGLGIEGMNVALKVGVTDTSNGKHEREVTCGHFNNTLLTRGLNLECNKRGNIVSIHLPQSSNSISICKIQVVEDDKATDIQGCPRPKLPKNGYLKNDQKVYDVGSLVTMLCKEGYAPIGQNFANCLADRSWDSPLPSCVEDVVFKKPTKIQVWDDSINDLTDVIDMTLTDGHIDSCLQFLSGQEYYLEIDLKDTFYISQILLGFGKQGMQVDLEIRIVDTSDYSEEREKQCGKISGTLELRGIIVPCRMDESNKSRGLKGNKLQIYLPMSEEPVSICKIQALSTGQIDITINDPNESDKIENDHFLKKNPLLPPNPQIRSNDLEKSVPERDRHPKVESGFSNVLFISTITTLTFLIVIIVSIVAIFFYKWRKHPARPDYQPLMNEPLKSNV